MSWEEERNGGLPGQVASRGQVHLVNIAERLIDTF